MSNDLEKLKGWGKDMPCKYNRSYDNMVLILLKKFRPRHAVWIGWGKSYVRMKFNEDIIVINFLSHHSINIYKYYGQTKKNRNTIIVHLLWSHSD